MARMSAYIRGCLDAILTGVYGRDVRKAIHDALEWCCNSVDGFEAWKASWEANYNAWKEDLEARWAAFQANIGDYIPLAYINEKSGDVVLSGSDIKIDLTNTNTLNVGYCLQAAGSSITAQQISGTDDYTVNVMNGGLVVNG